MSSCDRDREESIAEDVPSCMTTVSNMPIGDYLIKRLQDYGVRDVFGIPGDYILSFYTCMERSTLKLVGCTREDCAGFAADAYARVNGIGAVCVTYCVGGLSLCNSIAGAYAEKSPVVVISGSPGLNERANNPLLHHRVGDFRTQFDIFHRLCIADTELSNPETAFREIDRVLDAVLSQQRPGYIELPRDMVSVVPEGPHTPSFHRSKSDEKVLSEAVEEAVRRISRAERPVILAGVEIHRLGLQDKLIALAEGARIPITSTMLGKSVVSETHPLFAGIYEGALGREEITRLVEQSDCLMVLGAFLTDVNLGIYSAHLDPVNCIYATSETLRISHHHFHDVLLPDFVQALVDAQLRFPEPVLPPRPAEENMPLPTEPNTPISIRRVISRVNLALEDTSVVIADVGDALFASTELRIHRRTEFLSPAYYTSMGFAIPAALGAMVANPDLRPIVLVGDGAFQMTGMELSTIVRRNLAPIVLVFDNGGYGTERLLHAGEYRFNDIHPWHYHRLPEVLGGGTGYEVRTEGEFDSALDSAFAKKDSMSLIHIHLNESDCSSTLERLAKTLAARV